MYLWAWNSTTDIAILCSSAVALALLAQSVKIEHLLLMVLCNGLDGQRRPNKNETWAVSPLGKDGYFSDQNSIGILEEVPTCKVGIESGDVFLLVFFWLEILKPSNIFSAVQILQEFFSFWHIHISTHHWESRIILCVPIPTAYIFAVQSGDKPFEFYNVYRFDLYGLFELLWACCCKLYAFSQRTIYKSHYI